MIGQSTVALHSTLVSMEYGDWSEIRTLTVYEVQKETVALSSVFEKTSIEGVAIKTDLETYQKTNVALTTALEKTNRNTCALSADFVPPPRVTVALYTRLRRPRKIFNLDNVDKTKKQGVRQQLYNIDKD